MIQAEIRRQSFRNGMIAAGSAAVPCIGSLVGWPLCVSAAFAGAYVVTAIMLNADAESECRTDDGECGPGSDLCMLYEINCYCEY
jgi:hypothetical protein